MLFGPVLAALSVFTLQAQQPATRASKPAQTAAAPAAASQTGQQAQPPAVTAGDQETEPGVPLIKTNVNEVSLIFTVTDKHGHYIPNLKLSDFALLDNQRAPQKVTSFRQQINLPLRVGILIDTSTSIRSRFKFEQQAANEFLLDVLKSTDDRAFVMGFDVTPDVTQDWTNNLDGLAAGVNRLRPGGGTALFDAVYTACRDKQLSSRNPEPVRKAIILITDGDDDQSRVHLDEAIKECQRAETIIYAISTNWMPTRGRGDKVLAQMTEATGGLLLYPPSAEEMYQSFKNIEQELRSQYALTYVPADFKYNGEFRTIYLYCLNRHYQVRAKKGYFAPKQ
ncbi:MAG TPA: VWA domain-containing protein [Terracidiphilus sp.]|nr:VWA domain-containing protein [Terracidiphilus sp.]